jgi:hypothetical protein
LVTLLVFVCTGCGVSPAEAEEPDRFTIDDAGHNLELRTYVITDTETGVQYLFVYGYKCGGMTVLQPAPAEIEEGA